MLEIDLLAEQTKKWRPYRESNPGYFLGLGATWKSLFKDIYDTFDTDVRYPVALP